MRFEDFLRQGKVKKTSKDLQLVKSLLESSDNDLKFLKDLKIDEISSRKIFSCYYDTLRSVLEAMALLDGYKVYSHEAFTYYLTEKSKDELAHKFDRFRKIRNRVNYYGKGISAEEVKEYKEEIIELVKKLKQIIKKEDD